MDESESLAHENKKADVAEHPKAFGHVGLLFNKPPGRAGLFLSSHPTTINCITRNGKYHSLGLDYKVANCWQC